MKRAITIGILSLLAAVPQAHGQTRRAAGPTSPATTATAGVQELGKGWTALAAGRAGEAETIADALLQAGTRRHDATALKVQARVQAGRVSAALDAYEQWQQKLPQEDVFLLQPIARGLLETESHAKDAALRTRALQALAEAGDRQAAARLAEIASAESGGTADEALAELGNPRAIARLTQRITTPGPRGDVSSAIDALAKANAKDAAAAIAAALDPARPLPTKMSAARALGQLDAQSAIPQLKRALQDPDPPVRMLAAAALARLGDQSGATLLREMENSPVLDIRLMVVEGSAAGNPAGAWVGVATAALQDPDPLVKLDAATMLVKYAADPKPGYAVLAGALTDPNPAMRFAASRELDEVPPAVLATDVGGLRRLLRDAAPLIRVSAASALLRLAGGVE